jgi:hypothetical protein
MSKTRFKNVICYCFVLVLPIGLYQGDPDSADYQIGFHTGTGQVASVITGCEGPVDAAGSEFKDFSAEAFMKVRDDEDSPLIVGVRAGTWTSDLQIITRGYGMDQDEHPITSQKYEFAYVSPCIAYEAEKFGLGIGYNSADVPCRIEEGKIYTAGHITGHLRLGSAGKGYLLYSYMENSPLISSGGLRSLSLFIPLGDKVQSSIGISSQPYSETGFLQQNRIEIHGDVLLDLNWRISEVKGVLEYGLSAGIVYRFKL